MTPAEVVEAALRKHMRLKVTRTTFEHAQRGHPVYLSGGEAEEAARIAVDALKEAGLLAGEGQTVVYAEDLRLAEQVAFDWFADDGADDATVDRRLAALARLRAALPERTPDARL